MSLASYLAAPPRAKILLEIPPGNPPEPLMPTALLGSQRKEDRWNFFTSSVKKEVNPSLGILRAWAAVPPAHPTMYFRMARAAPPTSPCWPLKNRSFSPWANVASLKGEPPREGLRGGSPSEGGGSGIGIRLILYLPDSMVFQGFFKNCLPGSNRWGLLVSEFCLGNLFCVFCRTLRKIGMLAFV